VVDLADHAVLQVYDVTLTLGDKETRTVTAMTMLFTEDEKPKPQDEEKKKYTTRQKPDKRTFKVGKQEITSDTLTETYEDGKPYSRSWTSKKIRAPLQSEDAKGKVLMRLVEYKRGR